MERLPLFISIAAFLISTLVALFMTGRLKAAARGISLGVAFLQFGSAIWGAIRTFTISEGVHWSGRWFAVSSVENFEIKLIVEPITAILWVVLSAIVVTSTYFAFINQLKGWRTQSRGEAASIPLLGLGSILVLTAANFLPYYFGWALIAFVGFLAIGFSSATADDRATASSRYLILCIVAEILFGAGVLGCYSSLNTLNFADLNEKAASLPAWPMICLVLGTMFRNLQAPVMQASKQAASARSAAYPVFFIGHAVLASSIFTKIYPAVIATENIQYLAIIPAITALVAATGALSRQEPAMFIGRFVTYLCASIFMSGLIGDYQAAQALALTGSIGAFFLANAMTKLTSEDRAAKWLIAIAVVVLTGIPISGWGWARYLEYIGLAAHGEGPVPYLHWLFLGAKILADLIMALALWGVLRRCWLEGDSGKAKKRVRWELVTPVVILALGCITLSTGGRPFGGLAGQAGIELDPSLAWFEKLVNAPTGGIKAGANALELLGTDSDIIARIFVLVVLFLPALVAIFWVFRDERAIEEFQGFCKRFSARIRPYSDLEVLLWDKVVTPVHRVLGSAAVFIDNRVVDYFMSDMWLKPARLVRTAFGFIEDTVLDGKLVDGLGQAIGTIGKSLRLIQNGQVQFYFALGLILMGLVVIKFVVLGG